MAPLPTVSHAASLLRRSTASKLPSRKQNTGPAPVFCFVLFKKPVYPFSQTFLGWNRAHGCYLDCGGYFFLFAVCIAMDDAPLPQAVLPPPRRGNQYRRALGGQHICGHDVLGIWSDDQLGEKHL